MRTSRGESVDRSAALFPFRPKQAPFSFERGAGQLGLHPRLCTCFLNGQSTCQFAELDG